MFLLGVFLLSGGWAQIRLVEPKSNRLDQVIERSIEISGSPSKSDGVLVAVRGVIAERIQTTHRASKPWDPPTWDSTRTSTTVLVESIRLGRPGNSTDENEHQESWVAASGLLGLVLTGDSFDGLEGTHPPGGRVEVFGHFYSLNTPRNFGEPDWLAMGVQGGRVGRLVVSDGSMMRSLEHTSLAGKIRGRWISGRSWIRHRAIDALDFVPKDESLVSARQAMIGALLLGARDPEFGEVYQVFQRVGVAHVLAISGFHLGLVVLMVMMGVRLMGSLPRVEVVLIVAVLVLGMLLVPMRPPIVRAGVIVLAMLLAGGVGRRYDRLTVLGWVGVGLIIWRPMDVGALGYQLSMGITGVLVLVSIHQQGRPGSRHAHNNNHLASRWVEICRWIAGWFVSALKLNVLCWAVAMPVIVYHTGIVSVLAPVVSVVLVPMVGLLMALGYVQVLIGMISPELASVTIATVGVPAMWIEGITVGVDGLGYSSLTIGMISGWLCGLTSVMIALVGTGLMKWRDRRVWLVFGMLGMWWIGELGMWERIAKSAGFDAVVLRVDMLDVEDGTGVMVQSDGEGMLWDCGSLDWRVGSMVQRASRAVGVARRVPFAIITHDNIDHFNGLIEAKRTLGIEKVYVPGSMIQGGSHAWKSMRQELAEQGVEIIEIKRGDVLELGQATLTCLWPDPELSAEMSENNQSVVVRLEVPGGGSVLLCGDIEHEAIEAIELLEPDLRADVVELPHHGSRRAGSSGFVESLSPMVVLQSTGKTRAGYAYWDTLKKQTRWYITADHGGVWVEINQDGTIQSGSVLKDSSR